MSKCRFARARGDSRSLFSPNFLASRTLPNPCLAQISKSTRFVLFLEAPVVPDHPKPFDVMPLATGGKKKDHFLFGLRATWPGSYLAAAKTRMPRHCTAWATGREILAESRFRTYIRWSWHCLYRTALSDSRTLGIFMYIFCNPTFANFIKRGVVRQTNNGGPRSALCIKGHKYLRTRHM